MSSSHLATTSVILPPRLFGSIAYYAALSSAKTAYIDYGMRFDKRDKAVHRYDIADTRGRLSLTVPVSRPSGATRWSEILISPHARWWEVHFTALESAYGRTPFFEYYADRFRQLFTEPSGETVAQFCRRADQIVLTTLAPDTNVIAMPLLAPADAIDLRRASLPAPAVPYWQVRAHQLGFIADLSILDLLFNLGPEAKTYLENNEQ